jgi:hypothetical protein
VSCPCELSVAAAAADAPWLRTRLQAQGIDALWGHLDRQLARRGGAQEPATSSQVSGSSSGGSEAVMAATAEPDPGAASAGGGRSPQDVLVGIT